MGSEACLGKAGQGRGPPRLRAGRNLSSSPGTPLSSYVTLGELLPLSEALFPHV